jgi:type I restriction enzyme S subunit
MKTQKRIADILSAYDDLIENNLKRIKLLEQAAQNIYKEWFVNMRFPGYENTPADQETGLPKGWKKTLVTNYFDFIRGVEVGSKNYVKEEADNTIPFLRVGSLGSRDTDIFTDISLVKDKILSFSNVCISMDGSIGLVGYGLVGAYSTGIRKVSSKIEKYGNGFIFCLLKSQDIQDTIRAYAKGSTILHASSSIKNLSFKDASREISSHFNNVVEPLYNQMLNLNKQNQKLKEARDILLPRLMNQTIEV